MPRSRLAILLVSAALPAAAEALGLWLTGLRPALGMAPQASAPAPFGVFHDLRWIFVFHHSWWLFAAELLAAIAFRGGYTAVMVVLSWPPDRSRPPLASLFTAGAVFAAVSTVTLWPWTAIMVAGAVTSLSWFFVGALLPVVGVALMASRGGIGPGWWRGLPSWAVVGWMAMTFLALTAESAAVVSAPGGWAVPVAAASGALNGLLWLMIVRAVAAAGVRLSRVPVAVIVMVGLMVAIVPMGLVARASSQYAARSLGPLAGDGRDVPQALLFVAGYDSTYDGGTDRVGLPITRFSYRGLGPEGKPLSYTAARTHQSLDTSAGMLANQVAVLHAGTGRPVALIAQSEGTLVVRDYLDRFAHPGVTVAILLSPLAQPGSAYYPPRSSRTGWGVATGWALRVILAGVDWTGGTGLAADQPFVRSLLDHAPRYRNRMFCPVPGVRVIAFLPLMSAVVDPPGGRPAIQVITVQGLHGSLFGRPADQRDIITFLRGGRLEPSHSRAYRITQRAAAGWQAPTLPLRINPVWRGDLASDGCVVRPGR